MRERKIKRSPLEAWVASKIGCTGGRIAPEELARYQLCKLRETIEYARLRSPFYRSKLGGKHSTVPSCLHELTHYPFTTSEELREEGLRFLCVSQDEIQRIVTLNSSGTTGVPKRLFFTAEDQELTVDFLQCGTANLVEKGDRVLVLLPGETPGSVGDLLAKGIDRFGAVPVRHGMIQSLPDALARLTGEGVRSIIGLPSHVFALARYAEAKDITPRLRSVALVSDHVSSSVVAEIKRIWECAVFQHYGSTEMGLGGGVDCEAHAGYHLREADLYFEIVHPETGELVRDGEFGEIVFTTLTRRGMPLIRYRTGDHSRILAGPCACGSVLRRLEPLKSRGSMRVVAPGHPDRALTMAMLDEVLFKVPGVIDFAASLQRRSEQNARLTITGKSICGAERSVERVISEALDEVDTIYWARRAGSLAIDIDVRYGVDALESRAEKRTITEQDCNGEQGRLSYPARQNSAGG